MDLMGEQAFLLQQTVPETLAWSSQKLKKIGLVVHFDSTGPSAAPAISSTQLETLTNRTEVFMAEHCSLSDFMPVTFPSVTNQEQIQQELISRGQSQGVSSMVRVVLSSQENSGPVTVLSTYGATFPDFLEKEAPFSDLPFLLDLARYEWTFKEMFHARQHVPVLPDTIQSLSQGGYVRFQFGKAMVLFQAPYSVYYIWKLCETPHNGCPLLEWNRNQRLLLYKKNGIIFVNEIEEAEFQVLKHLQKGECIEDALNLTLEHFPQLSQEQVSAFFSYSFIPVSLRSVTLNLHRYSKISPIPR